MMMLATAAVLVTMAGGAFAAEVEVKMLNKGAEGAMVFEPSSVKVAPGDTVKFLATEKAPDVDSIPGMLPEGSAAFPGKISQDVVVTFVKPRMYGYRCKP